MQKTLKSSISRFTTELKNYKAPPFSVGCRNFRRIEKIIVSLNRFGVKKGRKQEAKSVYEERCWLINSEPIAKKKRGTNVL